MSIQRKITILHDWAPEYAAARATVRVAAGGSQGAGGGRTSHGARGARPSSTPATRRTGISSEYVQLRSTAVFIHSLKAVYAAARTAVRMAMGAQRQRTGSPAPGRTRGRAR